MSIPTPKGYRAVNTGRGVRFTARTPVELAAVRAALIDNRQDRILFMDNFVKVRLAVRSSANLDELWSACQGSASLTASYIEALASLRAEGYFIP